MSDEKENNLSPEDQIPETLQPSPVEQLPGEEEARPGGQSMETTDPPLKLKPIWLFVLGFLGWFLVNGLVWLDLASLDKESYAYSDAWTKNILCFPANLIILIVLAIIKSTRPIAFGILAAIGLNLIISLVLGITDNGPCLVPFFY